MTKGRLVTFRLLLSRVTFNLGLAAWALIPFPLKAGSSIAIQEIGSFYVGGRSVQVENHSPRARVHDVGLPESNVDPNGDYVYGPVYVQFVKLSKPSVPYPLMLWHGGSLSGVSFESTPDGREGWQMNFLRAGYSIFVPDAPQSGRSPWARFPEIGREEPSFRDARFLWEVFRIGPPGSYAHDTEARAAYPDTRFPLRAFDQLARQAMPRFRGSEELERSAYSALVARVCPCILLTHSASGPLGEEILQARPDLIKGLVSVEPSAGAPLKPEEAARVARVPQLFVWGDHLDEPESRKEWGPDVQAARDNAAALRVAGASVAWIDLPQLGVHGNSHLLMMDDNSADIAHLIDHWIRRNVH
jgi:pimeloyl-ACP methyl ester carboxylesterase